MRQTKAQRLTAQNAQWCAQYKKPDWDGCRANDYFAGKYRPDTDLDYKNKPKMLGFDRLRETDTARNNLYYNIAHLAFQKQKLIDHLSQIKVENIHVPDSIEWKEDYINAYVNEVKVILQKIEDKQYSFQEVDL